jgi:hypothetical protein
MNSRERVLPFLAGQAVDRLPCMPLTKMFASDYIGTKYLDYTTDFRVAVRARSALRGFRF